MHVYLTCGLYVNLRAFNSDLLELCHKFYKTVTGSHSVRLPTWLSCESDSGAYSDMSNWSHTYLRRCISERGVTYKDEEENHVTRIHLLCLGWNLWRLLTSDFHKTVQYQLKFSSTLQLTMKNWQRVMWGKMLWALFLPQVTRLCCQKWESWFCSGPLGRR